jgi:trypsin
MKIEMKQCQKIILCIVSVLTWGLVGLMPSAQAADPPTTLPTVEEQKGPPPEAGEVQERAVPRIGEIPDLSGTSGLGGRLPVEPGGSTSVAPSPSVPATGPTGPLPVVGGTFEPDYRYPWVVHVASNLSCGGVLIDPQWVLTAAHCAKGKLGTSAVSYRRTDPYTGAVHTETRASVSEQRPEAGVYIHPDFNKPSANDNDIALIKLAQPFTINHYIQTVGLPRSPRSPGMVGTVASISHTGTPPAGQISVFRGPISAIASPTKIIITAAAAMASLCEGDSGSGFVTLENGRAIVRGTTSQATVTDCMTPSGEAVFMDVFVYRSWILQMMGKTDASLAGNTRVRWSGHTARGKIVVGCDNPYGVMWGPLNVVGVEEGVMCTGGQAQGIICQLDPNQASTRFGPPQIVGLSMRTTMANGTSQVVALPFVSNLAQFAGTFPAGASREFTCQIGTALTVPLAGTNAAIMSRGIEGESAAEPTVEQPSPFDQPESTPKNPPIPSVEPQR